MKKYTFNTNIINQLNPYKEYLKKAAYNEHNLRQETNYTGYFLNWLEKENLQLENTSYNDILNFIDYCKQENNSNLLINSKLRTIRNYYKYLKKKNPNIINPASRLYLKGIIRKIPSNIVSFTELEKLYQSFETTR